MIPAFVDRLLDLPRTYAMISDVSNLVNRLYRLSRIVSRSVL